MGEIDLAPNHKLGCVVRNPVLLSPAAIGLGDTLPRGLNLARVGGAVVGPVSAAGRGYRGPDRLIEFGGGILSTGSGFSRSARRAVERYGAIWERLGCAVIVQLVDDTPADLVMAARRVVQCPAVAAIEWSIPASSTPAQVGEAVKALALAVETPIWVKGPLESVRQWAERAVAAGAAGGVVGKPLQGTLSDDAGDADMRAPVTGDLYGPWAFAATMRGLLAVVQADLGCARIACGGIYTAAQARQALSVGAHAIQVDAALWTEPGIANRLADVLEGN